MEAIVGWLLALMGIYLVIGFLFAVPFAFVGAKRIDPSAAEGTWGFKLLIIPGSMVFWPLLASRWFGKKAQPEECSAHRSASRS